MEEEKKNIHSAASAYRAQDVVDKSQFSKYHTGKDGRTGHGFAAEDVNDLADRLRLKNTEKVGTNNAKNGADRMVDGVLYQTKYCKTPNATVNAAFDRTTGLYRYKVRNGRPMKLEVPKDQVEQCTKILEQKIIEGKVPGVKNPKHASKMIKPGVATYDQTVQIAKSGTIESLKYDFASGAVTSASAAGISAAITYFVMKKKGAKTSEALKEAAKEGAWTGGSVSASTIISSQCSRKLAERATQKITEEVVEKSGSSLLQKAGTSALKVGSKANVVAGVVTTAVISRHDIKKAINKEITVSECVENVAVNATSVTAGLVLATKAAAIGSFAGPVGTACGFGCGLVAGVVGSVIGEKSAREVIKRIKKGGKKKDKKK